MMRLASMPASIALRVWSGRQSTARRSSRAGRRRLIPGAHSMRHPLDSRKRRKETFMRLGVNLGYWGLGLTAADQLALALEAEAAGYDSLWTAEAYGSDAATPLAWFAAQTERIKLGAAILQMPGRSPAMTAMTAVTLDHLSNGRFLLGLGTSGPQVAEGWHGQRFGKQLARTREYVEIVRKALARERLVYEGETYTLPLPDGPGKALKLMLTPVQERMPIYIAAIGPKNTQLVGEIADGVDRARDAMRPFVALYVGGMGSREKNFYNRLVQRYGFEDAAREIQDLYLDGKKEEAAAAIPPELIDLVSLAGPRDRVRDRLEVYREAGVGTLIVSPMEFDPGRRRQTIRDLAGML